LGGLATVVHVIRGIRGKLEPYTEYVNMDYTSIVAYYRSGFDPVMSTRYRIFIEQRRSQVNILTR
jgi:hypothetical protein